MLAITIALICAIIILFLIALHMDMKKNYNVKTGDILLAILLLCLISGLLLINFI